MIKVYSAPKEIPAAEFLPSLSWEAYNKRVQEHVEAVKVYAKKNGSGKYAGEEISFPVADGHARYVVFSPGSLIHLNVNDAWQYQYVTRLTQKDIADKVEQEKAFAKLFSKA